MLGVDVGWEVRKVVELGRKQKEKIGLWLMVHVVVHL